MSECSLEKSHAVLLVCGHCSPVLHLSSSIKALSLSISCSSLWNSYKTNPTKWSLVQDSRTARYSTYYSVSLPFQLVFVQIVQDGACLYAISVPHLNDLSGCISHWTLYSIAPFCFIPKIHVQYFSILHIKLRNNLQEFHLCAFTTVL